MAISIFVLIFFLFSFFFFVCVCVRACVHACVRACVRACVYVCVRARVRARARVMLIVLAMITLIQRITAFFTSICSCFKHNFRETEIQIGRHNNHGLSSPCSHQREVNRCEPQSFSCPARRVVCILISHIALPLAPTLTIDPMTVTTRAVLRSRFDHRQKSTG